jgi:hypothetical protein
MNKFWEGIGSGLSAQWVQQLFGPAFLFWGGGLLIYIYKESDFYTVWNWISSRDTPSQVAFLLIGAFVLLISSKLMEQLRFPFLRLLEGYWVWPFNYVSLPLVKLQRWMIQRDRNAWNELMNKWEIAPLSASERDELSRLEVNGHYAPSDLNDCMPTSLGNILKAAEATPHHKYGLDAVICWPRLWLLLPKETREILGNARQSMDAIVELWAWGLVFLVWTVWWPMSIIISLIWMIVAYLLAVQSAKTFSDLLESAFDLHRWSLYESVRWNVPAQSGEDEVNYGQKLTEYLWRGTTNKPVIFNQNKQTD